MNDKDPRRRPRHQMIPWWLLIFALIAYYVIYPFTWIKEKIFGTNT